jgi:hypothetical protein
MTKGLYTISSDCFLEMQSPTCLHLTAPYHQEETAAIEFLLKKGLFDNVIIIGGGNLRYIDRVMAYGKSYTVVDPNITKSPSASTLGKKVTMIKKSFDAVQKSELPVGPKLFIFLFNSFAYLKNALEHLSDLTDEHDSIVLSGWNNQNPLSLQLQQRYYDALNSRFHCSITTDHANHWQQVLSAYPHLKITYPFPEHVITRVYQIVFDKWQ